MEHKVFKSQQKNMHWNEPRTGSSAGNNSIPYNFFGIITTQPKNVTFKIWLNKNSSGTYGHISNLQFDKMLNINDVRV